MVNLLFCKKGTSVIEYETSLHPWLFYGGVSLGLKWWPIVINTFAAEEEILNKCQ
jgi:hypothetical protein